MMLVPPHSGAPERFAQFFVGSWDGHLLEIPWNHFVELERLVARHSLSWKSEEAWRRFRPRRCNSLLPIVSRLMVRF